MHTLEVLLVKNPVEAIPQPSLLPQPGAQERLERALHELQKAIAHGHQVSAELLEISGLLERGIVPARIKTAYGDVIKLMEIARAIEAELQQVKKPSPWRPSRRVPV